MIPRGTIFLLLAALAISLATSEAGAACSSPAASIGSLDFQSTLWKYCDGTNWLTLGGVPTFPLTGPNGTATGPTYSFSAGTNTGMYSTGAGTIAFSTAGTLRAVIDSSGNVGIGTTSPNTRFHVEGGAIAAGTINSTTSGEVRFYEAGVSAATSNYVSFRAPTGIPSNVTWHLPTTDGANGTALTTNGAGSLSWVSPSSGTWQIKSANYTAVAGDKLMVDTSGGVVTITLPASPTIGQTVDILDVSGSFATNNLTVGRNGSNIMSLAQDMTVSTNNSSFTLVYSNATYGWRIIQ